MLEGESFIEQSSVDFSSSEHSLKHSLEIVKGLIPVAAEIEQVDWPASSMVRMVFFCAEERDCMMIVVGNKEACELF